MMKQKSVIHYQLTLCCIVIVLAALTLLIKPYITAWLTPLWLYQLFFFFCINLIIYHLTQKKMQGDAAKFANFYMILTVTKLVLFLSIILIYAFSFPEDAKRFIISFLGYYICFMVFNIINFVKMKKNGK